MEVTSEDGSVTGVYVFQLTIISGDADVEWVEIVDVKVSNGERAYVKDDAGTVKELS